jgi:hypothetical protein
MKRYKVYLIVLFLISCDTSLDVRKTYTVSGIYYDTDEVTPLKNETVYLEGESTDLFKNYYEILAETTTDENGYFELTYKKNRKASTLAVLNFNQKIVLASIPKNKNFYREICRKAVGYFDLKFNIERQLKETDTIIILMHEAEPITTHFEGNKNYILFPFDELQKFKHIKTDWNRGISNQRITFRWGIGNTNFLSKGYEVLGSDGYPENYKQFNISGFPYTDTGSITIK